MDSYLELRFHELSPEDAARLVFFAESRVSQRQGEKWQLTGSDFGGFARELQRLRTSRKARPNQTKRRSKGASA